MEIITNNRIKATIKYLRAFLFVSLILLILGMLFVTGIVIYAKSKGAPPLAVPQSTLIYAEDGTLIGETHYGEKRYWVHLDEMNPAVIDATLSIEDRKFYKHHGFDYFRIVGAVLADIKAGAKVQGASTISQQYARNLFLTHDKTWHRKITEALYTIRLELNYSKDEILEGYLNTIYYGHGAYGIEAAADYYFGKHAKDLTKGEATLLAGIPKGPSHYSPKVNEEAAKKRQKLILSAMVANNYLEEEELETIYAEELHYTFGSAKERQVIAPYFQDEVKKLLERQLKLDQETINTSGLRVYTTLDPKLQSIAEQQIEETINPDSEIQVGFVAIDQHSGEVKAMVGGRDYNESPFNRVTQAERQPGSTFKPFLYYAALEQGFTPSTSMRSEVTAFTFDDGKARYVPHNFNNYYANDQITLAQAIALSDNVYAVKTHIFLGEDVLVDTAKSLGITSKLAKVPSLALGTSTVKVIDMASAYSTIANGGMKQEPIMIEKVLDHKGEVIYESNPSKQQVLKPETAFVTTHLLTGIFDEKLNDYTRVTGRTISDQLTRHYAGKTGTTKTDSWMIGYSPQLVSAVWTGYDRDKTIDLTAEKGYAKEIWARFMEEAHKGLPVLPFKAPEGVVGVRIDTDSGLLATKDCAKSSRLTYFVKGTEPTETCTGIEMIEKEAPKETNEDEKKGWFKRIFDWF
ncbi:transglycosylase domain-containing protein [Bacillus sp. PS06]|uniref:transglycosylase domain-containing protein n=1 Tax=Bacillus sp. PS06 TaxID=2764176 RepID=UPI00177D5DB3|nr:PBP1A family penicillin-binding protein [Bacillus sp. PS06]MBD8071620.1 PBP1A family penicillin-binding protein [Bacillus sp. PS06]